MRRISNHVSGEFARSLQAHQVSVAEWVVLRIIHEHEQPTPGQLAEAIHMTRGAISKIVEKLEMKGLIARETSAEDGRVQWLSLTREGARLLPRLAALADLNDECLFGGLAPGERERLWQLLVKLTELHHLRDVPVD
jgi:DNA-binding MarR family transcriptional regulator